jgi:hypothetical protein
MESTLYTYSKFNALDEWVLQILSWKFEGGHPTCLVKQRCQIGGPQITDMGSLGPAPIVTGTIAFNPTFGSFTLLELVSH